MITETSIVYLVEEHCSDVLTFSHLNITWKAYDRPSALIAAATLLASGYKAKHYEVPQANNSASAWHVQASFH